MMTMTMAAAVASAACARSPAHAAPRNCGFSEAAREVVWQVPPATSSQL